MPFAQFLLWKVPPALLCLIIVTIAASFAAGGLLVVRKFVGHRKLKVHHEVADPILGAVSTLYAVLLAFVVVTVWLAFDKSSSSVRLEANYMADIYRDSQPFPAEFRLRLGELLHQYAVEVVEKEWPAMQTGHLSADVDVILKKIWDLYVSYEPKTSTEKAFYEESVRKLNSFAELRRQRLMDSRTGIPDLLWFVLIAGALSTISFTFLFGTENLKAQVVMVVLLSVVISLILFTIMSLDYPFTGKVVVSSQPFSLIGL